MNVRRISFLTAALALAAAPAAFAADPPHGSHGQETDTKGAAQISMRCAGSSRPVLVHAAPRGSNGRETDQPTGSQVTRNIVGFYG